MSFFGSIIRKVIAPLWAIKEKSPYLQHLKLLESSKYHSFDDIVENQRERLNNLLYHAVINSKFYSEKYSQNKIFFSSIQDLDEFLKIPLLTKNDIRHNKNSIIAANIPKNKLIPKKTSGSTGISLDFLIDEDSSQWKRAVTIKYDRWAGWDIGEKIGAIWGNPEPDRNWRLWLRNLLLERRVYLDTLKMDEKSILKYHATLAREKPIILFGHAHSLYLFAQFIEKKGLASIRVRGIISTCMVLHDFERKVIERVFKCRVTNRYGCEEVSLIACECPEGNMHLNLDTLIVEFVRDGKPVQPGEPGAIVVTDLTNYGMPFIRYKVGDVGIPSNKMNCACGCIYPIMDSLEGRVADYVITPDGKYISGISLTENFALHLPDVKQMQIIQERIDFLVFRIVKGEAFNDQSKRDMERLVFERFGERMHYDFVFVDSIQSELSGKYRFCISKVQNPFA